MSISIEKQPSPLKSSARSIGKVLVNGVTSAVQSDILRAILLYGIIVTGIAQLFSIELSTFWYITLWITLAVQIYKEYRSIAIPHTYGGTKK